MDPLARRSLQTRPVAVTTRRHAPALSLVMLLLAVAPAPGAAALPATPAGWPSTFELGLQDGPGGAAALRASAPFGLRYQYLAGGVNTGSGWATWNPDGGFVTGYVAESVAHGMVPVFSYYMLLQSLPGNPLDESLGVFTNLQDRVTMTAYYLDLTLFFKRAGASPGTPIVLHVEPDFWGHMERRAVADQAPTVPAQVAATGIPELAGLPDDLSGFARAIVRLRDAYAPNVRLAYHLSIWGTDGDIAYSDPPDATVDALASRAAAFFLSLGAPFDLVFGEFSDRDAGFKQYVQGDGGASWWDAADFARHVRFLGRFVAEAGRRVVLWQIPLGNTRMRAMDDTWNHYQDNRVEWLLDDPTGTHLAAYRAAGVVALLFGRGADGATCACDAAGDGVTNPAPIGANTRPSLNADDDGGFFREQAAAYYAAGALPLGLALSVATNATAFAPGETLEVSVSVNGPGFLGTADFYFGVLLPDGDTVISFASGSAGLSIARLATAASLAPAARGVDLTAPFRLAVPAVLRYTWTGAEPPGRYVFFLAAATPGGLTADRLLAIATATVTLGPPR